MSAHRSLAHGANPVTRWMAANVAVAHDPAGNLKPAKDKSTERIDGIVALIMAIGRGPSRPGRAAARVLAALCLSRSTTASITPAAKPAGSLKPAKGRRAGTSPTASPGPAAHTPAGNEEPAP